MAQTEEPKSSLELVEGKGKAALELCFITLIGLAVIGSFVAALSYDFISARAPFVVMVPLLVLVGVQINRTRKQTGAGSLVTELSMVCRGQCSEFNTVAGFIALMVLLLLLIYLAGHYVGISVFMLVLLRFVAREKWLLSLSLTCGVTSLIYMLFEHGFNIELYRGYAFRLLAGYV